MSITLPQKHNLTATTQPTVVDDAGLDFTEGSRWIDTRTGIAYVCVDDTPGQAIWLVDPYSGIDSVAGLRQAMGGMALETPSRFALIERFSKRPFLAADVTFLTDSSGGSAGTPNTLAEITTGGSAADQGPVADAIAKLALKLTNIMQANADFEVAGTNMTSAKVTMAAASGGLIMTTAGAEDDSAILQPRLTNANDTRWAKGVKSELRPILSRTFRAADIDLMSVKCALALTNAHNLTTDNDQVGVWFDGSLTTPGEGDPYVTQPNLVVIYSIGGTDAVIDTGIAMEADTEYAVDIAIDADRKAHVWINGVKVAMTPALATNKTLLPFLSVKALEGAAKSLQFGTVGMSMERAA